jgi:hypothetical protein
MELMEQIVFFEWKYFWFINAFETRYNILFGNGTDQEVYTNTNWKAIDVCSKYVPRLARQLTV